MGAPKYTFKAKENNLSLRLQKPHCKYCVNKPFKAILQTNKQKVSYLDLDLKLKQVKDTLYFEAKKY